MRYSTYLIILLAFLSLTACQKSVDAPADVVAAAQQGMPEKIDYNLHVKPILSDRCFACHGPDKNKQQAGLRLDTPEGAYEALAKTGNTAVVPGNPAHSELIRRILTTDPDDIMPTPKSNLTLSAYEKAVLLRWVEQGAEYKPHWSLVAPVMPKRPDVKETQWVKNDIDRFVLNRIETQKLAHAPEADKTTLLRRVSLDLTGLPPTAAEIDAFLADTSPEAYERVVNRLLSSPHYGERQAVDWLDLARYADTHGYQDDGLRTSWPYRDWVIRAFNQNLRYDNFITWQLAGDMLPYPSPDKLIATAFNRNHQQSQEGGIVDEEYRVEYVANRTDTFGKAMLGMTVECARCHDHKYDPISQKDYYSLYAFFNNANDRGQIPYNGEASPTITLTSAQTDAQLKYIREKLTPLSQQLNPNQPAYQQRFGQWLAKTQTVPLDEGMMAHYTFDEPNRVDIVAYDKAKKEAQQLEDAKKKRDEARLTPKQLEAKKKRNEDAKKNTPKKPLTKDELWKDPRFAFANSVNDTIPARLSGEAEKLPYPVPGRFGMARFLPGDSQIQLPNDFAAFEQNEPFTISAWFKLSKPGMEATLMGRTAGPMDGNRGYLLNLLPDGRLKLTLNHVWPDNSIDLETQTKVPVKQWFQVAFTYDGLGKAKGVTLYVNGEPVPTVVMADHLVHSMFWGKGKSHWVQHPFYIGRMHDYFYKDFAVDELRIYKRCLTPLEMPRLAGKPDALRQALQTPTAQRTAAQRAGLYTFYISTQDTTYKAALANVLKLRGERLMLLTESNQVMIMQERRVPRQTYMLNRGAYDAPGAPVGPMTPAGLIPFPDDLPKNRLGLAKWLLLPSHPLFSRVVVNRVWQQYFGDGLVKTSDDFGNQGQMPTHPELLDYLAVRFRESGWNVKALHKLIVMSATYRQSSSVPEKAREADPDNTLLTRGPSYRLSAEQVRDNALMASGLLNQRIGGPSVKPYQPAGIWEALATRNDVNYVQNHGDSLYRRSMYTIWKRSAPPPMMLNFDAAERHVCIVKRQKTSTPLQSLVTLNDPQFVEAARVLAQKCLEKGEKNMIGSMFKAVVSRPARAQEAQLMQQLYVDELADFRRNPKRAAELLSVGEYPIDKTLNPNDLAAWTMVANTIMNFDEAIVKR